MKTYQATWMTICAATLMSGALFPAAADQSAKPAATEDTYTGVVVFVDPKEHVLSVKGWKPFNKAFNLGDNCTVSQWGKSSATVSDLRPGEKVTVTFQDAHGVLIASRVEQQTMQVEGMVGAIDADKHTLTLLRTGPDKQLEIAKDCKVTLRDGKAGSFADLRVGNHVTVTFETPNGNLTAREVAQTSIAFTGTLTAIDLGEKTLKAKTALSEKKFILADNCAIVIHGKPDGHLADLKLNGPFMFSYDEINGINVVNRIAPAETP